MRSALSGCLGSKVRLPGGGRECLVFPGARRSRAASMRPGIAISGLGCDQSLSEEIVSVTEQQSTRQAEIRHDVGRVAIVRKAARQPVAYFSSKTFVDEVNAMMPVPVEKDPAAQIDDNIIAIFSANPPTVSKTRPT